MNSSQESLKMCGIYFSKLLNGNCKTLGIRLRTILRNRGPDCQNEIHLPGMFFAGFVLWQQGSSPSIQPLENDQYIFLLNGDIFNADKDESISDLNWLLERFSSCESDQELLEVFKVIEGPYSFILYNKTTEDVFFGRDSLGRNSLLLQKSDEEIVISSTLDQSTSSCIEIPPLGIYKLLKSPDALSLYPWKEFDDYQKEEFQKISNMFSSTTLESQINPLWVSPSQAFYDFNLYSLVEGQNEDIFNFLLKDEEILKAVDFFISLLEKSVKDRVLTTPKYCSDCVQEKKGCLHAKVAVLFSGGIDCTILASLVDRCLPKDEPVELLNVAFEKVGQQEISWDVPDRISAWNSYKELKDLFPERKWKLVEINVLRENLQRELDEHVKHLLFPLKTVLDESLGCVFWFASRGETLESGGLLEDGNHEIERELERENKPNERTYKSPARIILLGSGADELFGGYIRHRNAFSRCKGSIEEKLQSVENELELDWQRIPSRNLGRDDRVIADNAKTARSPFIEENIVRFVRGLRGYQKCCMTLPEGVGDKLFLRLTGFRLGLKEVVGYKKRAAQFGSRIADKKQNARDFSVYLKI
ncbi:ASNSD1 family protein [Megaselia abdita]